MGHPLGMDQRPLSRDATTSISIEVPLSLWQKHKAAYTLTQNICPSRAARLQLLRRRYTFVHHRANGM
jgi:hypothetical protein